MFAGSDLDHGLPNESGAHFLRAVATLEGGEVKPGRGVVGSAGL